MIDTFSHIVTLVFLLFLSGFFSGAETALFSLNKIERRRIAEKHPLISRTVELLLERPRRTLITILIGNMVVNTMATAIATLVALQFFGNVGVGVTIVCFAFILLMIGEIMPKIFAIRNNVLITEVSVVTLNIFAKLIFPFRYLVRHAADLVISFLIKDASHSKPDLMSENELKALVKIGEEEGVLRKEEVRMISRLIDFGNRAVKEIMTPQTDFVAFDIEENREALIELIRKSQFSHIPIYEKSIDNLLGVISSQEFMLDTQSRLQELIQASEYIPETKRIDELLVEFRRKGKSVAICVDEYGAVSGLVTFEDILEEIFGEFHDEYAQPESLIKDIGNGEYVVQAKVGLRDLNEKLGIHLHSESSETLNGWLLEKLGRIPTYNESFVFEGLQFQISEVFKKRIVKVLIRKKK